MSPCKRVSHLCLRSFCTGKELFIERGNDCHGVATEAQDMKVQVRLFTHFSQDGLKMSLTVNLII